MNASPSSSLVDLYRDALGSFGRRFFTHLACWLAWALGTFAGYVAVAFVVGVPAFLVASQLDGGPGAPGASNAMVGWTPIVVFLSVVFAYFVAAWCVLEAATLEITRGDLRGSRLGVGAAFRAAIRRLPTQAGIGFLGVVVALPVIGIVVASVGYLDKALATARASGSTGAMTFIGAVYGFRAVLATVTAFVLVVRARYVFAGPFAQFEHAGVREAYARSAETLRTRWLRLGAVRVLYWGAVYGVVFLAMRGVVSATGSNVTQVETWSGAALACLVLVPIAIVGCASAFDMVVRCVMYQRGSGRPSHASFPAEVFE